MSSSPPFPLKIGIIGFGPFAQFLTKTMLKQGHSITATSRTDYSHLSSELGIIFFRDVEKFYEVDHDVMLICTSILSLSEVGRSIPFNHFQKPTLFVDVLSVKEYPKDLLLHMDGMDETNTSWCGPHSTDHQPLAGVRGSSQSVHMAGVAFHGSGLAGVLHISYVAAVDTCRAKTSANAPPAPCCTNGPKEIKVAWPHNDILPETCDLLCTHPMFGPESGKDGWKYLPLVYEKVRIRDENICTKFLGIFENEGCRMVEMSCTEHDRFAARSQFLTHTIGRILSEMEIESTPMDTKGFQTLLQLRDNTVKDSFDLYCGLYKHNKFAKQELDNLELAFQRLKQKLLERTDQI